MSKYLMEFAKQDASAIFEYDASGILVYYELKPGNFVHEHYSYFFSKFPIQEIHIKNWLAVKAQNVTIKLIPEDLSFENFYELYNHKYGKKVKSKSIWEALPTTEKAKALAYIQRYNQFLSGTGTAKKYPETYLNQQIWNN
jgi:hypothetical protein